MQRGRIKRALQKRNAVYHQDRNPVWACMYTVEGLIFFLSFVTPSGQYRENRNNHLKTHPCIFPPFSVRVAIMLVINTLTVIHSPLSAAVSVKMKQPPASTCPILGHHCASR